MRRYYHDKVLSFFDQLGGAGFTLTLFPSICGGEAVEKHWIFHLANDIYEI